MLDFKVNLDPRCYMCYMSLSLHLNQNSLFIILFWRNRKFQNTCTNKGML